MKSSPPKLKPTTLAATAAARDALQPAAKSADVPIYALLHGVIAEAVNNKALMKRAVKEARATHDLRKSFYKPQGAAAHKNRTKRRAR